MVVVVVVVLVVLTVVVAADGAGWCGRTNTERVWKLMIFADEFPR